MNFGQMQTAISRRLLDPNNQVASLSDVSSAINASIDYWKFRRFWFNTDSNSAALTQGSAVIPLPDNFLVPFQDDDGFTIVYGNMRYPLKKIDRAIYDGIYLDNGYGLPYAYANLSGVYSVYFLPDQNYTVLRQYIKAYTDLSGNSDTNDFMDNADRLIMYWALANLFRDFRQDGTMSDAFFNSATNEYNNLQLMTTKSNATGTNTNHSIL